MVKRPLLLVMILTLLSVAIVAQDQRAAGPQLTINAYTNVRAISPYIYGVNFADETFAGEINLPVNRWGGNMMTRYNYQTDTANHAMDWYFENIWEQNPLPVTLPHGSTFDLFVEQNKRTATDTLMVIPMIGWTPKPQNTRVVCGFSVAKYGAQDDTDEWFPDCGNGLTGGVPITTNDPYDTSMKINKGFVQNWMRHLQKYGMANSGGVRFYNLDNEPSLWNETHRDVRKTPLSYNELRNLSYRYGRAIKDIDPNAQVLGPVEYGWTAYFYSALDWSAGGDWWNNPVDYNNHGQTPLVEWYLQQMKAYQQTYGIRILDYLDLHYYPAAPEISLNTAGDINRQALRLRSTRSLWDTSYIDESWIGTDVGEAVYLIPRMKAWVNENYPGTKIAITEYNWGGLEHINGALAQADVLGIFGREGVDLATLWKSDGFDGTQPGAYAFRIYRNYDGAGAVFGESSVQAVSANQDQLSIYAARRSSDNALTLVIINKAMVDLTSTVTINQFVPQPMAKIYRYSETNLTAIEYLGEQPITDDAFTMDFPSNSITLVEIADGSTELNAGGGFEEPLTMHWTAQNLTRDRIICNQVGLPPVANQGNCAFRFTGSGVTSAIIQTVSAPAIQAGDLLTIALWAHGKNIAAGSKLQVTVEYTGGLPQQIQVKIPKGTYGYRRLGSMRLITGEVSAIKVKLMTTSLSGKVFIDDIKLAAVPGDAARSWVQLPDSP